MPAGDECIRVAEFAIVRAYVTFNAPRARETTLRTLRTTAHKSYKQ